MNKEEFLSLIQSQILALRDRSAELQSDPRLMQDWVAKTKYLQDSTASLSPKDSSWLNAEYEKWYKKEILHILTT